MFCFAAIINILALGCSHISTRRVQSHSGFSNVDCDSFTRRPSSQHSEGGMKWTTGLCLQSGVSGNKVLTVWLLHWLVPEGGHSPSAALQINTIFGVHSDFTVTFYHPAGLKRIFWQHISGSIIFLWQEIIFLFSFGPNDVLAIVNGGVLDDCSCDDFHDKGSLLLKSLRVGYSASPFDI